MRLDDLFLWYLGEPAAPRLVGALKLVAAGKGVSLRYAQAWLHEGFALSEDLPLVDSEFLPPGRLAADAQRAVGAVDDARPDRWGEKVIRFVDKPKRRSLMEYLFYAGDDRFGALGVSTSASVYSPRAGSPLPRLDQAQQLSEVVAKIEASEPLSALEAKIIAGGGSPLGGAKPKALIEIDGEQWLVKFFNDEPVDAPLIVSFFLPGASSYVALRSFFLGRGWEHRAAESYDRNFPARQFRQLIEVPLFL